MWEVGSQKPRGNKFPNINEEILKLGDKYLEEDEAIEYLYKFMYENISWTSEMLLGVTLFPYQHILVKSMFISDYTIGIVSRGGAKSFSTAVFALLDAVLNQGAQIGIVSASFRQSKMIFSKMEDIINSHEVKLLTPDLVKVSKQADEWTMRIGQSTVKALPLGDGAKLRGFRFQRMLVDELLLMPEKILTEVLLPFLAVIDNPIERAETAEAETKLIEKGLMKEEDRKVWPNNKFIGLSSASYKFEYLYKLYCQYEKLIMDGKIGADEEHTNAYRTIIQLSFDALPKELYDANVVATARATMSEAGFQREYGALFTDDSSGYFKVSTMKSCTFADDGSGQSIEVFGDPKAHYILSLDPSWSESEGSDDFAMQVLKLSDDYKIATVVHSYAVSGRNLQNHLKYFDYLLKAFNVVAVVMDYNGGVQFTNSCNESDIFKSQNINFGIIDVDELDSTDTNEYAKGLRKVKERLNAKSKNFVFLRKPSSQWIRKANESLQAAFDHRSILFAGAAIDEDYHRQRKANLPIKDFYFTSRGKQGEDMKESAAARMVDFIEHQRDEMDRIKTQCALIEISTSPQGTQSFDLPLNLKKQKGANKARKDSYSCLVLSNWMKDVLSDMNNKKVETVMETFTPRFVK